jgi:cell division protein FtsA
MDNEFVFALDIGTRTVVGLLCRLTDNGQILVEHHHVECHPQRAMLDGQIHDVGQVSAVLAKVRESLEEKAGCPLNGAAIAAAGRALSTFRATADLDFPTSREVTREDVHQLEVRALSAARQEMARESSSLYCVGFSPVAYFLNEQKIANPVGQRGKTIGIEIIATFLPQVVVDGLLSSLAKAGLTVQSLTLEPIAAMAVAVPENLRLLNLALLDIGAGTSDIAVSREGAVISYGMVDMAGDEVTEAIAQHYLLDFNSAERVKINLSAGDKVEFSDVLGNKYSEPREKVVAIIEPVVDKLAAALAEAVKRNNGGASPAALFCAGGGSLTPLLRDYLALHLDLPLERIGLRDLGHLEGVSFSGGVLAGPEIVTPLGIAMTALKPRGEHFIQVWVNGQGISLFNVQKTTVAQALIHSGMDIDEVAGVQTGTIVFQLNHHEQKLTGQAGRAGSILVNGQAASLDTELVPGDRVEVEPGEKGQVPRITLGDLAAEFPQTQVKIDANVIPLPLVQKINGLPAQQDTVLKSGDRVEIRPPATVGELAVLMDIDLSQVTVIVDGVPTNADTLISGSTDLALAPARQPDRLRGGGGSIQVTVNGRPLFLPPGGGMLVSALAQAGINYTEGNLMITINGRAADLTAPLSPGDRIEVFWAPAKGDERA